MTAVNGIASKIDGLPLDQIADNIRTVTDRLADPEPVAQADPEPR